MKDLYAILGVSKNASQDDIKKAYRKLAKEYHPDLNPGNSQAEQTFKEISQAYDILADPDKRKRYDRGEIDASGQEQAPRGAGAGAGAGGFYRSYTAGGAGKKYRQFDFGEDFSAEDIFADLFGGGFRAGGGPGGGAGARSRAGGPRIRGDDVNYSVPVSFMEAANGARKRVRLANGETVDVNIPQGSDDGDTLRLKGKGKPGFGGGDAGDAFIKLNVQPHAYFSRSDKDVYLDLPITLQEALDGGVVTVPTLRGSVSMRIPPKSSSGKTLRLRGRGVQPQGEDQPGDQYVKLRIVLPEDADEELARQIRAWSEKHPYNPREKAGMV